MSSQPQVQFASRTDVGMRRSSNQDSLATRLCRDYDEWQNCGHLFAVADGMGGHSVGDLASRITVETLPLSYFKCDAENVPERLVSAIRASNRAIKNKATENPEFSDMGTTCSVLTIGPDGAYAGHVGDSRVYRVRDGRTEQLTFDHSLQWEMIRQGRATMENVDGLHPKNVITRCLGPESAVEIDVEGPFPLQDGDRFVICSDGLTGHVADDEIGTIVSSLPPRKSSRLLVDLANCRGGADNVTVVVVHVEGGAPAVAPTAGVKKTQEIREAKTADQSGWTSRAVVSRILLWLFLILGITGLGFLSVRNIPVAMSLVIPAVFIGLLRFFLLTGVTPLQEEREALSRSPMRRTAVQETNRPAPKSPYRMTDCGNPQPLLDYLATAQSELTQTARENGWDMDFSQLERLSREAGRACEQNQISECLSLRAEALDQLMKQLYTATRKA